MYALPVIAIGVLILLFKPKPMQPVVTTLVSDPPLEKETIVQLTEPSTNKKETNASSMPILKQPKNRFPDLNLPRRPQLNKVVQAQKAKGGSNAVTSDAAIEEPTTSVKQGMLTVSIPNAWAEI